MSPQSNTTIAKEKTCKIIVAVVLWKQDKNGTEACELSTGKTLHYETLAEEKTV